MVALEFLDCMSLVAWLSYEKMVVIQEKCWFKLPIYWNTKSKRATPRAARECLPYLLITVLQIPIFLQSGLIFVWQCTPKWADPRFPFFAAVILAFGCLMNLFITGSSVAAFFKRRDWCLCLNVVGQHRFIGGIFSMKNQNYTWLRKPFWKHLTPLDLISDGIICGLLSLGTCGFFLTYLIDFDPIHYILLDMPRGSLEWFLLKAIVRPFIWGNWTFYCMLNFFHTGIGLFYFVLHSCTVIPSVPKVSQSPASYSVIQNSISNFNFSHKLTLQLMEGAYKEYRQFQIFIRPANEAMYTSIPIGLAGFCVISIAAGVICINGYSILPISVYIFYPYILLIIFVEITGGLPIACNVLANSILYKKYWLSRIRRKEVRQRLVACRPMGIAVGPFGYIKSSLPMAMLNAIVDNIVSITVTFSLS
ncbi:unnamed protein product [Orchesella dallaii]|uniref:Odorant receptor n=1 Tax=Orchesella dallaii TaxID=48710 RepID=A0ABP1QK41_9HEXA